MKPRFSIVCFDVDSTIVEIEGIDVLAEGHAEVVKMTELAMQGMIPMEEVYGRRLDIIRPDQAAVHALADRYLQSIVPGVDDLFGFLHAAGVDIHLVTGGIEQAVAPLAERLGVQRRAVHAVALRFGRDGSYEGWDETAPTARAGGKGTVCRDIRVRNKGAMAFVGDGYTDLEAKPWVDCFIGFGGVAIRERVREEANVWIEDPDATALTPVLFEEEQ
ncbi:MAG: HAD-IB family phosphatase [Acidobacteria bacterium]|nr:HAD-IB family phosphatase [Acidobacteriota bacterium]